MRRTIGIMLAAGALCLAAGAGAERVQSVFDGGDPFVLVDGDTVWIYPTGGKGLEGWSSTDLVHWRNHGPLLRKSDITWIDDDGAPSHGLWAPDMLAANGRYYFYYSVGPQHPTPSRLGVATCEGPAGPCTDSGRPLLTGGDGFEAIDPMVFADARSGKTYLYAGGSAGSTLRVFVLTPDLMRIDHEVTVAQPPHFTEGAFMHERDGIYYLSYSHGRWNDATYSVHYATAPSPTGPWTYRGVILKTDAAYKGPGHHSFFRDPRDGGWRIAYHRWEGQDGPGPYRGHRRIAIQKISYAADGAIEPISMDD
ncbi:glycosyl hydrolase family 43 [Hephaestia caeni]|uniref:Glycosyl hydrolase family 43 n=1 Tax=Hephaestia caeni TaxID=645617 RepID=A0A397NVL1_9SPHN|nr:family 43 glycosylhydrolase [Hephaestia caeni]RIA37441.1 glycosyl hydrolase family 43 [Hephaestia caeni]